MTTNRAGVSLKAVQSARGDAKADTLSTSGNCSSICERSFFLTVDKGEDFLKRSYHHISEAFTHAGWQNTEFSLFTCPGWGTFLRVLSLCLKNGTLSVRGLVIDNRH